MLILRRLGQTQAQMLYTLRAATPLGRRAWKGQVSHPQVGKDSVEPGQTYHARDKKRDALTKIVTAKLPVN
jgi:hypothetical protein